MPGPETTNKTANLSHQADDTYSAKGSSPYVLTRIIIRITAFSGFFVSSHPSLQMGLYFYRILKSGDSDALNVNDSYPYLTVRKKRTRLKKQASSHIHFYLSVKLSAAFCTFLSIHLLYTVHLL